MNSNVKAELEAEAIKELLSIGTNDTLDDGTRLAALDKVLDTTMTRDWFESPPAPQQLEVVMPPSFHQLEIQDVMLFFVRCALALVPAVVVSFTVYVVCLLLSSTFMQWVAG